VVSIVIPTLDASPTLARTLDALAEAENAGLACEIIVADGGSCDGGPESAAARGARVVATLPGRGRQFVAGAAAAAGDWLLFLHADTVLASGWVQAVAAFMGDPVNNRRAAVFRFALDDPAPAARRLERIVAWRCRRLGLPYGDQGLLVGRAFYDALGGYRPLPLMEDVELVRRIGRRRLVVLGADAVTSAARYRAGGYLVRPLRNLACLGLYLLGLPPRLIARLYA